MANMMTKSTNQVWHISDDEGSDVDMVDGGGDAHLVHTLDTTPEHQSRGSRPPTSRSGTDTPEPLIQDVEPENENEVENEHDSESGTESETDDDEHEAGDGAPADEAEAETEADETEPGAGAAEDLEEGETDHDDGMEEEEILLLPKPNPALAGAGPDAADSSAEAAPIHKLKVKRRHRPPSPLPPPPPPLTTIRLEFRLDGSKDEYEFDIIEHAKATGQRPTTPKLSKDTSDEEGEGDDEADGKPTEAPTAVKPKRRRRKSDWYDLEDAFIDDTDLAIDERTTFAQTKQKGFYVSQGDVQLLRDKSPAKPRSKLPLYEISKSISASAVRPRTDANGASSSSRPMAGAGTKDAPISLSDTEDRKRKAEETVSRAGKKRRTEIRPFSEALQTALDDLKQRSNEQTWEKGKFPPVLKPLLKEVTVLAIKNNEYDENFFNVMPKIFPYNRFTMTKLVKRTICTDHVRILNERQDTLIEQLTQVARDNFEQAQQDYKRAVEQFDKRQEKVKADNGIVAVPSTSTDTPSRNGTPNPSTSTLQPHISPGSTFGASTTNGTNGTNGANGMGMLIDDPDAAPPATQAPDGSLKAPTQRYKLTDEMKRLIWELVCLSNECVRLENEKNELEGHKGKDLSEQGYRKTLYQKIVNSFPDGWMTSGQISREVSILKKRVEKEAMEIEGVL